MVQIAACPLCSRGDCHVFCERTREGTGKGCLYFACASCGMIFMDPGRRMAPEEERARYDLHRNSPDDERYLAFLGRLAAPLIRRLPPGAEGLDFGCGPGPALSVLFERSGFKVENYDPFYFPEADLLTRRYDFAACTEVVEHLFYPGKEWRLLDRLLKPGGYLGVMTEVYEKAQPFESWWYPKDPTHVCFYQTETFEWIASWLGWELEFEGKNVVIFKKS